MKYVVFGAGGTGGVLGFQLAKAGFDVTIIARNANLEAIHNRGLTLERMWETEPESVKVKACTADEYNDVPDVVIVCVKGYSLDDAITFIRNKATEHTIVIPVLNIYGTGAKIQESVPELLVTDGCIYVSANIKEPGVILQHGKILRVVFGVREPEKYTEALTAIEADMRSAGIDALCTQNIRRDALVKFSYVSPMGAASLYCNGVAKDFQHEGPERDMLRAMIREIAALGNAMGITFEEDLVERNLKILGDLPPESTTSMQRDVLAGKASEMDGLVFEVVRLGQKYGVSVPEYTKVAAHYGFTVGEESNV